MVTVSISKPTQHSTYTESPQVAAFSLVIANQINFVAQCSSVAKDDDTRGVILWCHSS